MLGAPPMERLLQPEIWIAFLTLASLEIVLGIDNIVFISILADRLPHAQAEGLEHGRTARAGGSLWGVVAQIGLMDIIFSLDSVITAVGMAKDLWVMVAAIVVAVGVMMVAAGGRRRFVHQHPPHQVVARP